MSTNLKNHKLLWLALNLVMVVIMVVIGGITRLTDSGLSMTDWRPILGIIPPLNQADWNNLFDLYKQYPEYKLKNIDMNISEFKRIFFWEYLHRIWGRLIGLSFFIPLFIIWLRGGFNINEKRYILLLSLVGFFQAFMGWYMVKSGLVDKPDVSHFRLSIHLITAFIIYSSLLYFFWSIFSETFTKNVKLQTSHIKTHNRNFIISLLLLLSTISAGALVSGTNAGLAYNNFPFMGDGFFPPILYEIGLLEFKLLFNDQGFLQFTHRAFATITLLFMLYTFFKARKDGFFENSKVLFYVLSIVIILQYTLGIIILKLYVPMLLGLLHQLGSLLMLSLIIIAICEGQKKGRLSALSPKLRY